MKGKLVLYEVRVSSLIAVRNFCFVNKGLVYMKKSLIGTTALVAAGMLATAGTAVAADPIKLSTGGYFRAAIAYVSEDDTSVTNRRNHAIAYDSELVFRGATTLDNGLEFGVKMEIGTEGNAFGPDEVMMYVENEESWGRIEMGDEDGAADQFRHWAPLVIGSAITGCSTFSAATFTNGQAAFTCGGASGDNTKITYRGPKLLGMQWGISYTPEVASVNSLSGDRDDSTAGDFGGIVELGANWSGTMGDASIRAGGGWHNMPAEAAGEQDAQQWNLGATISMGGYNIGGMWKSSEAGPPANQDRKVTNYRLGITTSMSGMTVGLEYTVSKGEQASGQDDETSAVSIAANRALGPGVSVGAMIRSWDMSDDASVAASENSATELLIITALSF